jgi:hypothetical protein
LSEGATEAVEVTVRYGTVQYSTLRYSAVQYSTVQYSTVQRSATQHSIEHDMNRINMESPRRDQDP